MSPTSESNDALPRSPLLMNPQDTALWVIDVQEKLLPLIDGHARLTWNLRRLLTGAASLDVAVAGCEQYPQGLGPTAEPLRDMLVRLTESQQRPVEEKLMFSCRQCQSTLAGLQQQGVHKLLLAGIETHVCVAQSALDLLAFGFDVWICVDAVGSRYRLDHDTALRRLESAGCTLTTTEAALMEWTESASHAAFKSVSALIKEIPPA